MRADFWTAIDRLLAESTVVIDRPRGSRHPRYPETVYPLDYGYLADTASADGEGIDLWRGSSPDQRVDTVVCTVDLLKRDSEVKLLLGCTEAEQKIVLAFYNDSEFMKSILIQRDRR